MQDSRVVPPEEVPRLKARKKKPSTPVTSMIQKKGETNKGKATIHSSLKARKSSKRGQNNDASPPFQQSDVMVSDSLPDAAVSSNDYRALRRKYLVLEEESCTLDIDFNKVEVEVKTLEDEKFALLDQLVVLEGLINPSELHPQGGS